MWIHPAIIGKPQEQLYNWCTHLFRPGLLKGQIQSVKLVLDVRPLLWTLAKLFYRIPLLAYTHFPHSCPTAPTVARNIREHRSDAYFAIDAAKMPLTSPTSPPLLKFLKYHPSFPSLESFAQAQYAHRLLENRTLCVFQWAALGRTKK